MQLTIAAERVAKSALRFRKRRRIESDKIVFRFGLFSAAQESENILLNPAHFQTVAFGVVLSGGDVLGIFFDRGNIRGASACAGQRKRSLIGETIEHAASFGELSNNGIIRRLIEIKSGFWRVQKIDIKLQPADFNLNWTRLRDAL